MTWAMGDMFKRTRGWCQGIEGVKEDGARGGGGWCSDGARDRWTGWFLTTGVKCTIEDKRTPSEVERLGDAPVGMKWLLGLY